MNTMQALVVEADHRMTVCDITIPSSGDSTVLVEIRACTICGSDIKLINGDMEGVEFPLVPGHEWSGVVARGGRECPFPPGTRVVADILQCCGHCNACRRNERNLCTNLIEPGLTTQGAFAQYIAVPANTLRRLPDCIGFAEACLVEPLSVVLHALRVQPPTLGDRVLVLGGGGLGLLTVAALRAMRIEEIGLIDPHETRRRAGVSYGATAVAHEWHACASEMTTALNGLPDVVYVTASRASAVLDAIAACRPGGRICQVGYSGSETITLKPADILVKALDIRAALSPTYDWESTIEFLANEVDVEGLVTHRFPLSKFVDAFDHARNRRDGALRIMVAP